MANLNDSAREKRRQTKRLWYQKHREERIEYSRRYREEHREQVLAASRKYNQEHREERREYSRAYREANRDRVLESLRRYWTEHRSERQAYRQKHSERERARRRRYYLLNPARALRSTHIRRARKTANGGSYSLSDIEIQVRAQGGNCWWCGAALPEKYHIDHRIPLSRGGTNNPENIVIACPACNLSKNDRLPSEWNGRLL